MGGVQHGIALLHDLSLRAHAIASHLAVLVYDQCLMLVDIDFRTEEVFWSAWCNMYVCMYMYSTIPA